MHELVSDLSESLLVKDLREDISHWQLILRVHVNLNASDKTRLPEYSDPRQMFSGRCGAYGIDRSSPY
jgi:hypothetical protein